MRKSFASHVCWLVGLCWLPALHAQNVRVMQWNVQGHIGTSTANSSAGAAAIARVVNYHQPDVLLINEVADGTAAVNTPALTQWVSGNLPYLATGTFYVAVSTESSDTQRNGAISRYPILTPSTYADVSSGLRGMHSFQVQLTGTNRLQIYQVHLKCCGSDASDPTSCQTRQSEADLFAGNITAWAATNSAPYIFTGDCNESEDPRDTPLCTITGTYHPITTLLQNGGLVDYEPTGLTNGWRTWSTGNPGQYNNIRFDYVLAATNRLAPYTVSSIGSTPPVTNVVFSTMDWAAQGLYTNASPANLANDSQTASDHFCVIVNYFFPTTGPADFTVTPTNAFVSGGNQGGPFTSNYVYALSNTNTTSLSWGVGKSVNWLTLSATDGTLGPSASTNITVSISSAANTLAGGSYSDSITFSNANTGASMTRGVTLTVSPPGQLSVSPATTFSPAGQVGGPFSPASQNYTLSNIGGTTLNWTAGNGTAWLTVAPLAGTLAGGASTTVVATVNASANSLAAGPYNDTISFTNTTNGTGTTNRLVALTVIDQAAGSFSDNMENGTNGWSVTGLWHLADANTSGCVTVTAHSASHAWWYGQESTCNYRTGSSANSGNLISPSFVVPASATLTFWSWEDTEGTGTAYDQRFVSISTNAGASWVQLLQSTNDSAAWYQVTINLAAYAGKNAQLRFQFNTVNGTSNRYGGWEVDDVVVAGPAVPAALAVTPAATLNASGEQGGPFTPGAQVYTLSNTGSSSLNWTAGVSSNWLSLSAASGTLTAGGTANVTVSTNANATALVGGLYSNLVSFVNATNGTGSTNVVWTLLVRDGVSDAWRQTYFAHVDPRASDLSRAADDPDGDGFTNLQEYWAGTDPTNSAAYFHITGIVPEAGGVRVTWQMGPDRTNAVQYTPGTASAGYTNNFVDDFIVTNTVGTITNYLDVGAATDTPSRFYRVRLVP